MDSPMELLATSRAVALLSDYGYGFKTKLLEAIIAGNRVLVTPGLYRRMPRILDPWTLCVDLRDPASFAEALDEARDPLPQGDPNTALREQHHAVLDALILGHVGPAP
ncbi:MAG: hypothetical protein H0V23_07465 [Nocardioidaceae bacterium]|nr:hypothetical protein [Nocardioidaceae bacterium]